MVNFRKFFTRKKKNSWKNRPNLPAGSAYNLTFKPPAVNMSRIVGISGGPEKKKWWHRFTRKAAQPHEPVPLAKRANISNYESFIKANQNKNNKRNINRISTQKRILYPVGVPFVYRAKKHNTDDERIFKETFTDYINILMTINRLEHGAEAALSLRHKPDKNRKKLNANWKKLKEKVNFLRDTAKEYHEALLEARPFTKYEEDVIEAAKWGTELPMPPRNEKKRNEFLENTGFYNKPKSPRKVEENEDLLTFPSKRPALKYPFEYPASNSNTEKEKHFKSLFEQFMDTLQEFGRNPKDKELERLALEFARELPRIRPLTARELELVEETGKAAKGV